MITPVQPSGQVATVDWTDKFDIVTWPAGAASSPPGIFAIGAAGHTGWQLTVQNIAPPGQRCTPAVRLNGTHPYPVQSRPRQPTQIGSLGFIALGSAAPTAGVAFVQVPASASLVWANPHGISGQQDPVAVITRTVCGQAFHLAGFVYPLAVPLDVWAMLPGGAVKYVVPRSLSRPGITGVWQAAGR